MHQISRNDRPSYADLAHTCSIWSCPWTIVRHGLPVARADELAIRPDAGLNDPADAESCGDGEGGSEGEAGGEVEGECEQGG